MPDDDVPISTAEWLDGLGPEPDVEPHIEVPGIAVVPQVTEPVPMCEPWPVRGCGLNLDDYDPDMLEVGLQAASELLWALSGHQFGNCEMTLRPCGRQCAPTIASNWWWRPNSWITGWPWGPSAGGLTAAICGRCRGDCACTDAAELRLPHPAQRVSQVIVDGDVLPPSAWLLYNNEVLVRRDGAEWPFCQDWSAVSGPGVFAVTAVWGRAVPALGTLAMGELLPEVLRGCGLAEGDCVLPGGVIRSLNRQGVSKDFWTSADVAQSRRLGLPLVDRFLDAYNPHNLTVGAKIWDPQEMDSYRWHSPGPGA